MKNKIPVDETGRIAATGTVAEAYHIEDTDGSWQEISLPTDVDCKTVVIQVVENDDTIYDPDTACFPFLFSHLETDGWIVAPGLGLQVGIVKSATNVIGKIKAVTGKKVAILIID